MKTITRIMAGAGLVSLASIGSAQTATLGENIYLNADAGAIFQQNADFTEHGRTGSAAFNPGLRTDIAIGYTINKSFAVELEPGFLWNSVDKFNGYKLPSSESIDLYSVPLLANVIYKFPTDNRWSPYVGLGAGANIGFFDGSLPGYSVNDSSISFAYQAVAGVKYAVSDKASVGIAYKFLGTTDQDYSLPMGPHYTDNVTFGGVYIHGVYASFTLSF